MTFEQTLPQSTKHADVNDVQLNARNELLHLINRGELKFYPSNCLCGVEKDFLLQEYERHGLYCPQVICLNCGIVRSKYFFDLKSENWFYENLYRRLYNSSDVPSDEFFNDQYERGLNLLKMIPSNQQLLILEIGCGAGGILKAFQDRGHKVKGYDYNKNYVSFAQDKGVDASLAKNFKHEEGKFDLIVYSHVFEHLAWPRDELKNARLMLKDDGNLLIEVPGLLAIFKNYPNPLEYFQNAHCYNLSRANLKALAKQAGFLEINADETIIGIYKKTNPTEHFEVRSIEAIKVISLYIVTSFIWLLRLNPYFWYRKIRKLI